jgi:hypothetical protein
MLFGKSLFQSVVDRLAEEETQEHTVSEPRFRIDGLGASYAPERVSATPEDDDHRRAAYLFLMGDDEPVSPEPAALPEPEKPAWIDRLAIAEIAADLAITADDDRETLQERRRAFARLNHPDRIHPDFRDQATTRMKIANLLVDEALLRCQL